MNRSTPGLPVHHQLLESTQTHAHQVGDAIQPSHPLSSPSPPAPNPSQQQGGSFPRCYLSLKGKKREGFSEPSMRSWGKTTTTHQKRGQHNKCPCPLLQPPPLPCWSLPNAFRSQRNRKPFDADPVGQPLRHRGRRWRQVEMESRRWFQRDRCKQPVGNYHLEYAYCLEKHHRRNWPCF